MKMCWTLSKLCLKYYWFLFSRHGVYSLRSELPVRSFSAGTSAVAVFRDNWLDKHINIAVEIGLYSCSVHTRLSAAHNTPWTIDIKATVGASLGLGGGTVRRSWLCWSTANTHASTEFTSADQPGRCPSILSIYSSAYFCFSASIVSLAGQYSSRQLHVWDTADGAVGWGMRAARFVILWIPV